MKVKNLLYSGLMLFGLLSGAGINAQNAAKQTPTFIQGPPQRTCGTENPSQQWEELFQKQIEAFLAANPEISANAKQGGNSTQAVYTIPVIIHVIHGGQAVGTFPNLAQGQLNSQIQVLNDDFAGVGYNIGNYPANAFTAWATNTTIAAASKDALGRIKISNTGVTFCLALKDTLGNTLAEPGIHRVNYNSISAPLTGTFTSKNPADPVYNTSGKFQGFINGYIKPNTIWNVSKYMNLWVTDEQAAVGLLGYATFPPLSGLTGIPGGVGTSTSDGFWAWAAAFGSKVLFPGGTYATGYDLGRTCTHEIGHWVGLRHIWGDGTCATDYCNDTPPASASNFNNCPVTYPLKAGSCAGPPSNSPNGEMFMNFMDYTYDCAMFMFTEDQRTRIQTAMANSPYRKFLGTHGLCSVPPPVANFTIAPNPICAGQTATITDLSTGSPGAWSYTMTGGSPSTSTLQSPTVTYTAAGVYSITLVASNGGGNSTPVVKTITVNAIPSLTVTPSPATVCAGSSSTITATGATTYSWSTSATTSSIVVTPTANTTYTVTGANGSCVNTKTVSVIVSGSPTVNITPVSATICAGNSTTLTGSGAVSYTWTPGGMTTTVVAVSPTVNTTYTLTGANAAGCTSTRTVQVTVNTTPTLSIVANPTAICGGGSATLTASGATTYSWNTSATTSVIVVTPTTTTSYTVTGSNGTCSSTKTISITVGSSPTVNITPASATICAGNSTTLTGSGATNYTWMPGGNTTSSVSVTPSITTTYTLTGTNASGCASTRTVQVTVNALPVVTITANPLTICPGNSSTLTASGSGPGPYTYSWSTGSTASSITTSVTGAYTASVTNANGCMGSQTFTLNAAAGLTINIAATPTAICTGGSATLSASGATTYTWNTSATTSSIVVSPTTTTTYTVNGTSGSCTGSNTISIVVNPNPTVTAAANPSIICTGQSSTLTASGASTYSWSTGSTSVTTIVSPTTTTTYTVTGTNGFGCSSTRTVSVSTMSAPSVSVTASPSSLCSGGSSTLTASGATTYTWNTSATTSSIVVSPSLTTTYTVTGANGSCTSSQTIQVTVNTTPTVSVAASPTAICAGGTASLNASGATTYSWSTGATTPGISVSPTTTTTYTVTGSNGSCSNTQTISLSVNPVPSVTITSSGSPICAGTSATLTGTGATNYTWMPGGMTTSSVVVSPTVNTTYTLTGSNGGSCVGTRTITINVQSAPVISVTGNPLVICPGNTSTLTANGTGPPGPFTYLWNTGATTAVITTSVPGVYTATFTNGNGCKAAQSITITAGSVSVTTVASPTSICSGATTTISASGATTYSWSTGATTSSIVVSPTLTTTYTVNGTTGTCSGSNTISITVNTTPTVNVAASPSVICSGNTATITASGASTYSWMPGSLTGPSQVVSPASSTVYTITGSNGSCSSTRTINITVNSNPTISVSGGPVCSGSSATLTANGATTYSWMPGSLTGSTQVVTPSSTTVYTVTGSNGSCSSTTNYTLVVQTSPTLNVTSTSSAICITQSATLSATGASGYLWYPGPVSGNPIVVSPSGNTTYTVQGNIGSCLSTKTISIIVNPNPTVSVAASPSIICAGNNSNLTASGATTYSWNTGATTPVINVTPSVTTTYTVTGSNGTGCSDTRTVSLSVISGPGLTVSSSSSVICIGQTAVLTASGSATTYTWSTGSNSISISVSPTVTTNYSLVATNAAGCTNTTSITQVVSPCTGIIANTNAVTSYGAYPNPNHGEFTVSVEKVSDNSFVEVYNTIGQLVNRQVIKDISTKINLTEQADGVYYVIVTKDGKHLYKTKVIKD